MKILNNDDDDDDDDDDDRDSFFLLKESTAPEAGVKDEMVEVDHLNWSPRIMLILLVSAST